MTFKMKALAMCRDILARRDAAKSLEDRDYLQRLFDMSVQDLIAVSKEYRRAAKRRRKRMSMAA